MLARLYAAWLLGVSLLVTLSRRVFRPGRHGLALFHQNYAEDRLLSVSPQDRLALPAFSSCIACGGCDAGQANAVAASHGAFRGMMSFVLSASRSIPDFDAAADALRHVDLHTLDELERQCPVHLPFSQLVAFVQAKATAMR